MTLGNVMIFGDSYSTFEGMIPEGYECREIFALLEPMRHIGLSLTDHLLMSPTKSVTAIVGLGCGEENCLQRGCQTCQKENCSFRKE